MLDDVQWSGASGTVAPSIRRWAACFLGAHALLSCGADPQPDTFSREPLLDPATCTSCHATHVKEWSGSMHAYAADDPVFLAMNRRGQRETGGALGDFCVRCHAPMAVAEGLTTDGLNLSELPSEKKGVTCYFCHNALAVQGTHNNPIQLAHDTTLRGAIRDPIKNPVHGSAHSALLDRESLASSDLCGACHDVVNGHGVALERTFLEWKATIFNSPDPETALTCGKCHMTGSPGAVATFERAPVRRLHEHTFAGVDVALGPWPEKEAQRAAILRDLNPTVLARMCVAAVDSGVRVDISLENGMAGHMWPSGAAQDRDAWVELVAYAGGKVLFQSGLVAEGQSLAEVPGEDLWRLGDKMFGEQGEPVHMFWEAKSVESNLLPPIVTRDPSDPRYYHAVTRYYRIAQAVPDRITLKVHLRPFKMELLESLIASGDLAPEVKAQVPTFTLAGTELEWTPAVGFQCVR
ncbi:MAG: multiheme c-type cytochrome [Polyangiaceae bacterium]|nr:multiheme c-type cytochrome [Polyangiaceae bacterium]